MLGILYLILMIIFALFYMHDQLIDFFEARTTITSKIVQAKNFEFPSLIVCMNPARKMSIAAKYGFKESNDVFYQDVPNSTLEKRYLKIFFSCLFTFLAVCLLFQTIGNRIPTEQRLWNCAQPTLDERGQQPDCHWEFLSKVWKPNQKLFIIIYQNSLWWNLLENRTKNQRDFITICGDIRYQNERDIRYQGCTQRLCGVLDLKKVLVWYHLPIVASRTSCQGPAVRLLS